MIEVTVKYFNILSAYAGHQEDTVTLPETSTVFELIMILVERNQPSFGGVVLTNGVINTFIRIFVNDDMISGDDLNRNLVDGDRVLLFPAVSGG